MTRARAEAPTILLCWIILFGPLAFGCVEPWSLSILEGSIFALAAMCLTRARDQGRGIASTSFPFIACASVALLGVLQCLNPRSLGEPSSLLPFSTQRHASAHAVVLWTAYAALCWSVPRVVRGFSELRAVLWTVFSVGIIVALTGILQRGQGNSAIYGLRPVEPTRVVFGPFYDHDHAAALMSMSVLAGAGLIASRQPQWRRVGTGGRADLLATQGLLLFLLGTVVAGVVETSSRGGMASLATATTISAIFASFKAQGHRLRWSLHLAGVVFGAAIASAVLAHPDVLRIAATDRESSTLYRVSMSLSGIRMLLDHPLFGVGLGSVEHGFQAYQGHVVRGLVDHVHDDWLELGVEIGLVGLAAFALPFIAFIWRHARLAAAEGPGALTSLKMGALAGAFSLSLHALVDFPFQIPGIAAIFLVLLVGISASHRSPWANAVPPSPSARRMRAALASAVLCVAGAALWGPPAAAWYRHRADQADQAASPYFLTRAYGMDADPNYQRLLAATYLSLAHSVPAASSALVGQAWPATRIASREDPFDAGILRLEAEVLQKLGRKGDAQAALERAKTLSFLP